MTRLRFPASVPAELSLSRAMRIGIEVSRMYGMEISPVDVARLFRRARVPYVLVGDHAINLYTGRPRATRDVDVIVNAPVKARRAIEAAFADLEVEEHPVVTRFKRGGAEVLD